MAHLLSGRYRDTRFRNCGHGRLQRARGGSPAIGTARSPWHLRALIEEPLHRTGSLRPSPLVSPLTVASSAKSAKRELYSSLTSYSATTLTTSNRRPVMFEPVRGGTRGGQAEFKWTDVSADKDREVSARATCPTYPHRVPQNYLGHSINAPTGRWQKNKDIHWYNREIQQTDAEREEELRLIREQEAEALAAALYVIPLLFMLSSLRNSPLRVQGFRARPEARGLQRPRNRRECSRDPDQARRGSGEGDGEGGEAATQGRAQTRERGETRPQRGAARRAAYAQAHARRRREGRLQQPTYAPHAIAFAAPEEQGRGARAQ